MVDHFQIATQGIGPGWSTFHMASMGFGFDVEIEIKPVQDGGGGWKRDLPWEDTEYVVTVRVKYKGQVWQQQRVVSKLAAQSLEKVLASFRRITNTTIEVSSSFINIIRQKVAIFAKKL
jgi:hypothetical protein